MTATPETVHEVYAALHESHREWPHSDGRDTVDGDPWPLAWDGAAFVEEWFKHPDHNDVEEAICHVPIDPWKFGYDITEWHDKKSPEALLRAQLLRIVKGWSGETALVDYLEEDDNEDLVDGLGFNDDDGYEDGLASKPTLWRVWNENRLRDEHKEVIRTIGQVLVNVAREHNVPAPEEVFHPDPSVDAPDGVEQDDMTVRDRTIAKTRDVWEHGKMVLTDNYEVPRADNTKFHENAFLEGHTHIGAHEQRYAESGIDRFAADTTRDTVHTGSNYRYHLKKIGVAEARKMHQSATKDLIERARRDAELTGKVRVSVDITKSNPYRSSNALEFDSDGNLANKWLLGYKDGDEDSDELPDKHFQWASIQIVGMDIPLVLDALPVHRGLSRGEIVDELVSTATEMVDVGLVLMDAEFDSWSVKLACERHGVGYFNAGVMQQYDRGRCTEMRRSGKLVHVEEDKHNPDDDNPTRKRVYVPAIRGDLTDDSLGDDGDDTDDVPEHGSRDKDTEKELREEMVDELSDVLEQGTDDTRRMFGEFLEEVYDDEEQRNLRGSDEDARVYTVFKTNHPDLELTDGTEDKSEIEQAHMVARIVRLYSYRWGIENGFKQIKQFRVRTTSMDHEYRFFNFLFACTLYNLWRLVDILVKLELRADSDFAYKPIVTADLFLTIASDYFGLDPPD
ncbi:Transposase DDE domain-containing protein [Halovenus aranensis]|uniref:Transposase DDE domain-containing protein n=2 Tax=Halovenus aranensis TaxID=890420 RepID=A0A1G8ZUS3_9EURY|nr:Transposase DDE domain-containing protein [Halovenus aranensis]